MRVHDALRHAGGAAGVHDVEALIGRHLRRRERFRLRAGQGAVVLIPGRNAIDQQAPAGEAVGSTCASTGSIAVLVTRQAGSQSRSRAVEPVGQQQRRKRHERRADGRRRPIGFQQLQRVAHAGCDPVAAADAEAAQHVAHPRHAAAKRAPVQPLPVDDHGKRIGAVTRVMFDNPCQRQGGRAVHCTVQPPSTTISWPGDVAGVRAEQKLRDAGKFLEADEHALGHRLEHDLADDTFRLPGCRAAGPGRRSAGPPAASSRRWGRWC
jgi:hypothetical protein